MQKPYVFRGESKCFPQIATKLHRRLTAWRVQDIPTFLPVCQTRILQQISRFLPEFPKGINFPEVLSLGMETAAATAPRLVDLLCRLQHFGGTTNLLDFTKDYLVALFFACVHHESENGRVIFLSSETYSVWEPVPTDSRIQAQKSCVYWVWQGEIPMDSPGVSTMTVPHQQKAMLLQYLDQCHNISIETIYPDLQGAISWSELGTGLETEDTPSAFWQSVLDDTEWSRDT